MASRDRPAGEPFESRDRELGAAPRTWVEAHPGPLDLQLQGPLYSAGMDPTWVLRITGRALEAEVALLYGPYVEVAAFRSTRLPEGLWTNIGDEPDVTPGRLNEMLDELTAVEAGAAMPHWLYHSPND